MEGGLREHGDVFQITAFALAIAMLTAASSPSGAVVSVDLPNTCADKNALQNIAFDARLEAVKMYYKGYIQNLRDRARQVCLEAHVLLDDHFAVINKTRDLIESECLAIDIAAMRATQGLCP